MQLQHTKYEIGKYVLYTLPNESVVVQNQYGVVKVTDLRLISMLKNWENDNVRETDTEKIFNYFLEDSEEVIEFLCTYNILEEKKQRKININKISILANNKQVEELLTSLLVEEYGEVLEINNYDSNSIPLSSNEELLIVFLNPYSKKLAKMITDRQKKCENSLLIMSYVYNNNFYIDCVYSPKWISPCHHCHMGHIEAQSYLGEGNMTYQYMIDTLYSEDSNFQVEMPLNSVQKINLTNLLITNLYKLVNDFQTTQLHPEEFTNCSILDLQTLKVQKDNSIYWELCDCYE